jgi:hypothetical protein
MLWRNGRAWLWVLQAALLGSVASCTLWDDLTGANKNGGAGSNVLWHVSGAGSGGGSPGFDGTTAFFMNASHGVVAIDGQSGAQRWTASTGTTGGGTYGEAGCVVVGTVVACGDDDIVGLRERFKTRGILVHEV